MNWVSLAVVGHVLIALAICGLVLLQHGKGADMGSGFGGGASSSLFGATGSANFLSRATAVLATIFFVSSLTLAWFAAERPQQGGSIVDRAPPAAEKKAEPEKPAAEPAKPAPPANEKSVPQ
jgi:preprotein translocase subunit SecG